MTLNHPVYFIFLVIVLFISSPNTQAQDVSPQDITSNEALRWERQAQHVTTIRDDWGIPHIYGRTDADAVLGFIYAQAEDDFNRIETNYLKALGRLAEVGQ